MTLIFKMIIWHENIEIPCYILTLGMTLFVMKRLPRFYRRRRNKCTFWYFDNIMHCNPKYLIVLKFLFLTNLTISQIWLNLYTGLYNLRIILVERLLGFISVILEFVMILYYVLLPYLILLRFDLIVRCQQLCVCSIHLIIYPVGQLNRTICAVAPLQKYVDLMKTCSL